VMRPALSWAFALDHRGGNQHDMAPIVNNDADFGVTLPYFSHPIINIDNNYAGSLKWPGAKDRN